jgi:hypothetical protein
MKLFQFTIIFLFLTTLIGCYQTGEGRVKSLREKEISEQKQRDVSEEQEEQSEEQPTSNNPEDVTVDDIVRFVSDKEQLPEDFIKEQDTSTWQEVVLEEEGVTFKMPKHWTIRKGGSPHYCINDPETFKEEGYVIGTWDCRIVFSVDDVKLSDILQVIEKRDNWYDMQYNVSTIDNHTAVFSSGFGMNVDILLDDAVPGFTFIEGSLSDSPVTQDFLTMILTFKTHSE